MKEIKKITVIYIDKTSEVLFERHPIGKKRKATTSADRYAVLIYCFPASKPDPIGYSKLVDKIREGYFDMYSQPIGITYAKEILTYFKKNSWIVNRPKEPYYFNL